MTTHESTLGPANFQFAEIGEIDTFMDTLTRFEQGEIDSEAWRAFRLLSGTYGQRQDGDLSMLRVKIPQGVLSATQAEALASVADRYSRGFLHLTTRQNVQYHFLRLAEVSAAMRELAEAGLTTREACGNSVRNVTASATAGVAADEVFDVRPYAEAFTRYFLRHPLSSSLPRKFKVAFDGGGSDHAFALVNDIGYHARIADVGMGRVRGFRITVAGGTAILCRSGEELFEFLPASEMLGVAEAIVRVFHAKGDRVHRHKNRMKFLVKQMGWEAFRDAVLRQLEEVRASGAPELPFDPEAPPEFESPPAVARDPMPTKFELIETLRGERLRGPGLVPRFLAVVGDERGERFSRTNVKKQRQPGFATVTVTLPLGDISGGRLRALARIARSFSDGTMRTTHGQNLLFRWVPEEHVTALYELLRQIDLAEPDAESLADVTSCPGAESCKLAVTQSRGLADFLSARYREDRRMVDRSEGLSVRVSGCPNGCGLHHVSAIGFQGSLRKVGGRPLPQYFVYVGGNASGDEARFGRVAAKIPARRAPQVVERLVELYERERNNDETMTAYLTRTPLGELKAVLADLERLEPADAQPEDFVDLGDTAEFRPENAEGECAV